MGGFDLDTAMQKIGDYSAENSSDNNTAVIALVKVEPSDSENIHEQNLPTSEQVLDELESDTKGNTPLKKSPIQPSYTPVGNSMINSIYENIKGIKIKSKLPLSLKERKMTIRWIGLIVMLALSSFSCWKNVILPKTQIIIMTENIIRNNPYEKLYLPLFSLPI